MSAVYTEITFSSVNLCLSFPVLKFQSVLSEHRNLAVQFHLECAHASLTYYRYQAATEHLQKAQQLSGLTISMTGR